VLDEGGAVVLADEAQVDPPLLLRALQQACARSSVAFRSGTLAQGVELAGGRARGVRTGEGVIEGDSVVVAAGSWSSLVSGLPDGLRRVHPVRGQIVQVETRPPIAKRIVFGEGGYVVPRPDGRVLLGSTMEEVGHVKEVTVGGVHAVLGASMALFPKLAQAPIAATWSGFRPATRGDRPMLGKTSTSGLFVATGHHRNGILMAPETARLLADLIVTGRCDRDLAAFAPEA
jgi:glycine oxidase